MEEQATPQGSSALARDVHTKQNGEPVGNVLWTDGTNECVISIKRDDGEYENAWHALFVYTVRVVGEVGREEREQVERVFEFEIAGEDSRDMRAWRDRARGQRIGIVGLGGVGLWDPRPHEQDGR